MNKVHTIECHIVPAGIEEVRLSDYAANVLMSIPSRKGVKKAIKRGAVLVDGKRGETGTWVKAGQKIEFIHVDQTPRKLFPLELDVCYEDEYLAVLVKPAGYPVSGNQYRTITNALAHNLKTSTESGALQQMYPVHRLDSATSGLLLIAKTHPTIIYLGRAFEQKEIQKTYQAVVIGKVDGEGIINQMIDGKAAETHFRSLGHCNSLRSQHLSLLELQPITGRTHQLRIHLQQKGWPILGDKLYSPPELLFKGKGLFLSAISLSFIHPINKEWMKFEIDAPAKFHSFMEREQKRWEKYRLEGL